MKNTKAILAGLVWMMLISCGDYSNQDLSEDLAFLRAIPSRGSLELRVADTSPRQDAITQAEGSLSIREDALLGEQATYYLYASLVSVGINRGVFGFLDVVDWITQQIPPTQRSAERRVWGPWQADDAENTDVRFVMTRQPASAVFGLFYQVRDSRRRDDFTFDEGWANCVFGQVEPSGDGLRRGLGNLTIDLNACARYSQTGERGLASVGFDTSPDADNLSGKTSLQIVFDDFLTLDQIEEHGDLAQATNATYLYIESSAERRFDFLFFADVNGEPAGATELERVAIEVRWDEEGRGQAAVSLSEGDFGALFIELSECWDAEHARVYYRDSHDLAPEEGDSASCPVLD